MAVLEGRLFDGQASRPVPVRLAAHAGALEITTLDGSTPPVRVAAGALVWHEPLGHATRRVDLPGGAHVELRRGAELDALLAALGHRERAITRWQGSGLRVAMLIVVLVALGVVGYRWGLPLGARLIAQALPTEVVQTLDRQLLATLDESRMLAPTRLPESRIAAIEAVVAPILAARSSPDPVRLHFRAAEGIGANAFALPGGDIVVTDALVKLAPTDLHVAAVIAHEMGHVAHRHGLRNLIQASVIAGVVTVWTGDASTLATAGATVLLGSAYSRDFEHEADAHGADLLERVGQSPVLLADMLGRLAKAHGDDGAPGWGDYLSSHPATAERIARLKQGAQ